MEDTLQKVRGFKAEFKAMTPDERAEFARRWAEDETEFEWHNEVVRRIKDGTMSLEEAEQWINAMGKMIEDRRRRMDEL
jgi:hypothetical protein